MTGTPGAPVRVRQVLPHRYPMLLVDRIVELAPERHVTALKAVSGNEPWYSGLPDDAADGAEDYPQVLVLESWCQSAVVLGTAREADPDVRVPLLGGVRGVSFAGRVHPGDVLVHRVELVRRLADAMVFAGESAVGTSTVMTVDSLVVALRPPAVLAGPAAAEEVGPETGRAAGR